MSTTSSIESFLLSLSQGTALGHVSKAVLCPERLEIKPLSENLTISVGNGGEERRDGESHGELHLERECLEGWSFGELVEYLR